MLRPGGPRPHPVGADREAAACRGADDVRLARGRPGGGAQPRRAGARAEAQRGEGQDPHADARGGEGAAGRHPGRQPGGAARPGALVGRVEDIGRAVDRYADPGPTNVDTVNSGTRYIDGCRKSAGPDELAKAIDGSIAAQPAHYLRRSQTDGAYLQHRAIACVLKQDCHEFGLVECRALAVEQGAKRSLEAAVLRHGFDIVVDVFVDQVRIVA